MMKKLSNGKREKTLNMSRASCACASFKYSKLGFQDLVQHLAKE